MPNKNRRKGDSYEYRARDDLYREGAIEVHRAAGSFGVFDLWALFSDHIKLISVKSTLVEATNYAHEIQKISDVDVPGFCKKELWIWVRYKGWKKVSITKIVPLAGVL